VWQGKRFKTKVYKDYEKEVMAILPDLRINGKRKLMMYIEFGLFSKNADIDNYLKPFIDICQKKYGFNDKMIFGLHVKKVHVKKDEQYISFEFEEYR